MLTKDQDEKKINYMGLSELMRMIIIFVTFCLNKKKCDVNLCKKELNVKQCHSSHIFSLVLENIDIFC